MKARTSGKYLFLNGEKNRSKLFNVSSVQSLTRVRLFATPWIAACQASLSITNSRSLPKLMSIGRWCHPVLFYSICNMYTLGAFSVFFFCLCMCFLLVFSIFFFLTSPHLNTCIWLSFPMSFVSYEFEPKEKEILIMQE